MSLNVTDAPVQSELCLNQFGTSVPELLLLRFIGDECVEGKAGELWQELFSVERDVTRVLPSILPPGLIESLLKITESLLTSELQFRQFQLKTGGDCRFIEAQIIANLPGESVIILRDVTLATRARAHLEHSTSLVALLSPRELDVIGMVVRGKPNKDVAAKLKISAKTVEKHRATPCGK